MYLVHGGAHEDLEKLVSDPDGFQTNGNSTAVVGIDQTPVYLRLRGESQVMVADEEVQARATRRHLTRLTKSADPAEADKALQELLAFVEANPEQKLQTFQMVSQGGDKYRLTLCTIQAIVGWFDPQMWPQGEMPRYVLLVPCKHHCQLENIDAQGKWIETVFGS